MGWTRRLVPVFCTVAMQGACAHYRPAPLSAQRNAASLDARSLDDPRLGDFLAAAGAPPCAAAPCWTLDRLTLAAVYYHPNLDIARSQLALAEAGVTTARQIPNPSLTFEELSYTPGATGSPWVVAPVINFLIETFGKREHRTEAARHLVAAAQADITTATWQVRAGVRNAMVLVWAAQQQLALARHRLDLENELSTLVDHRFAAGGISALDLEREHIARDEMSLAVRQAEKQQLRARLDLAAAVGIPLSAVDYSRLSFAVVEHPAAVPADKQWPALREAALRTRSDIQASLAAYAAAESELALQIARQYPDIQLGPGYNYDQGQNRYLLLPTIELPVFNQNQGPVAEARARRAEAAARFTALQKQIIDEIDGATGGFRTADQTLATADAVLASEQDQDRRSEVSFAAGALDRPGLLAAEITAAAAAQSHLQAEVEQRQALGALEDAFQQPFFDISAALPQLAMNPRGTS